MLQHGYVVSHCYIYALAIRGEPGVKVVTSTASKTPIDSRNNCSRDTKESVGLASARAQRKEMNETHEEEMDRRK